MSTFESHLLSCWIIEAARSMALERRGHADSAVRAAGRARILAHACAEAGVKIRPEFANSHAEWVAEVAGSPEESGALGWFFLQRLGAYVDLHLEPALSKQDHARLVELGAPDAEAVAAAIAEQGLPPGPPPEWPTAADATAPGEVRARIGVIGDPHIGMEVSDAIASVMFEDLNREGIDFSVLIGDITQNGKPEQFVKAKQILGALEAPWVITLGNHDMWGYDSNRPVGLERFTATFERKPYAVHETDGVRAIVINSADPMPSPFPPFDIIRGTFLDEPNEAVPGGRISEEVSRWLSTLDEGPPTLIFLHHPSYPYLGFPPITFGLDEPGTNLLGELVDRTGAWGVVCGHTHRSALYDFHGVPFLEVPSPKEWPFGYGLIEVSDRGWSFNLKPVSAKEVIEAESARTNLVVRRYARGPDEARGFSWTP